LSGSAAGGEERRGLTGYDAAVGVHPLDHARGGAALEVPTFGKVVEELGQYLVGGDDLRRLERRAQGDCADVRLVARVEHRDPVESIGEEAAHQGCFGAP
jgi:hypothetical protein